MALPRLYPILDTAVFEQHGFSPIHAAAALLDAGAGMLQYRHKAAFSQARYEEAQVIAGFCRSAGALFIMNDRADFARILQSGLHLGQDDLPPDAARSILGPDLPIGFSTHNEEQLRKGAGFAIDYLAIGPIFSTGSKKNAEPELGLAELARLRALTQLPLVAIGGITLVSAAAVYRAGVDSVAVISDLLPPAPADLHALRERIKAWMSVCA